MDTAFFNHPKDAYGSQFSLKNEAFNVPAKKQESELESAKLELKIRDTKRIREFFPGDSSDLGRFKIINMTSGVLDASPNIDFMPELEKYPTVLWEGYVKFVDSSKGVFFADLVDRLQRTPDQHIEMDVEEVPEEDQPLIKEGAVFYWTIGKAIGGRSRQEINFDEIRFRRQPNWTKNKLEKAKAEAEKLYALLVAAGE